MKDDTYAGNDPVPALPATNEQLAAEEHLAELLARHEQRLTEIMNANGDTPSEAASDDGDAGPGATVIDMVQRIAELRAQPGPRRRRQRRTR